VFHRYYDEGDQRPGFYLDDEARDLGHYGRIVSTVAAPAGLAQCPVTHGVPKLKRANTTVSLRVRKPTPGDVPVSFSGTERAAS
jgi:hypothetical protein